MGVATKLDLKDKIIDYYHLVSDFKDFDWYLKADHDTFTMMPNLKKFVHPLNPDDPMWFGYKLKDPNIKEVIE